MKGRLIDGDGITCVLRADSDINKDGDFSLLLVPFLLCLINRKVLTNSSIVLQY